MHILHLQGIHSQKIETTNMDGSSSILEVSCEDMGENSCQQPGFTRASGYFHCDGTAQRIKTAIQAKIINRLPAALVNGIGPVSTNVVEHVHAIVAKFKTKGEAMSPERFFCRSELGNMEVNLHKYATRGDDYVHYTATVKNLARLLGIDQSELVRRTQPQIDRFVVPMLARNKRRNKPAKREAAKKNRSKRRYRSSKSSKEYASGEYTDVATVEDVEVLDDTATTLPQSAPSDMQSTAPIPKKAKPLKAQVQCTVCFLLACVCLKTYDTCKQ
jgi:hypothetical protein